MNKKNAKALKIICSFLFPSNLIPPPKSAQIPTAVLISMPRKEPSAGLADYSQGWLPMATNPAASTHKEGRKARQIFQYAGTFYLWIPSSLSPGSG
jgi:hypothetical protein